MSDYHAVIPLADDALISAQRMGWWISRAPQLEEDLALANIGLDQLGQARALLSYAGQLEGAGRDEDQLAYFRDEREFRNVQLLERPQTDFAVTMTRLLFFSAWQCELYADLAYGPDPTLAAIAGKAVKEVAYHYDHAAHWVVRLGDGTEISRQRMTAALAIETPYLPELIDQEPARRDRVLARVDAVLDQATLSRPAVPAAVTGGRRGIHTEHFGYLLAEMQHLARSHPGVTW